MTIPSRFTSLVFAGGLALAACGGSDEPVSLDDVWARATAPAQPHGAVYFQLSSNVDDVLTGASVDPAIAADAQLHEVLPADEAADHDDEVSDDMSDHDMSDEVSDDMSDHDMSDEVSDGDDGVDMEGSMVMQELADGMSLTDGDTVSFEPGGFHVMLFDLADPLEVGEEFELTLEFADGGDLAVTVPVRDAAP